MIVYCVALNYVMMYYSIFCSVPQAAGTTEDAEDLQRKVAEKNDEVARLQTLVRDLQRGLGRSQQAPDAQWQALPSSEMAREQQKLDEVTLNIL